MKNKHFKYVSVLLLVIVSFLLGRESKGFIFSSEVKKGNLHEKIKKTELDEIQNPNVSKFLNDSESKVFVCNGMSSKRFHMNKKCSGLSSCKSSISEITLIEAQNRQRTICRWED